ncbi:MAG: CinA family protein [Sterolibacterium sp.]|nr:CinA family protein [Sterolibacterium sp.]
MNLDIDPLAAAVGAALSARQWQLTCAESCTGGLLAAAITAIAGSSSWFERGFIPYSNAAKQDMLGVPASLLAQHGAVSEATVQAMAQGALQHAHAQVAVAISGIAGPTGAVVGKPVGTVCFAWALPDPANSDARLITVQTRHFSGDRTDVRKQATHHALRGLLTRLEALELCHNPRQTLTRKNDNGN